MNGKSTATEREEALAQLESVLREYEVARKGPYGGTSYIRNDFAQEFGSLCWAYQDEVIAALKRQIPSADRGVASDSEELRRTVEAIDGAWRDAYGGDAEESFSPTSARNRVSLLAADLKCQRDNFRVTNAAYVKADAARQALELHLPLSEIDESCSASSSTAETAWGPALEELVRADLALAKLFNRMGKDDGATVAEWDRARQDADKARVAALRVLRVTPSANGGVK